MTPGNAKPRSELPWLPYRETDKVFVINSHNFGGAWTPADITTALWLDAADPSTLFDATSGGSLVAANGAIARWEDKSGNARHATQTTLANRPTRRIGVQNVLDIVRFDGSNNFFNANLTLFANKAHVCVFAVVIESTSASRPIFYASRNDSADFTRASLYSSTSVQATAGRRLDADTFRQTSGGTGTSGCNIVMADFNYAGNAISQRRNATTNGSGNTFSSGVGNSQNSNSVAHYIGWDRADYSAHDFCEFIHVESPSSTTRELIEGYLAHKWGLTSLLPSGHPSKSVAP
jgi:hypothetical protein